jgi:hypothetical protein
MVYCAATGSQYQVYVKLCLVEPEIRGTKATFFFRHDAGIFRPNKVSRRNFDGMKTPNPKSEVLWCL